jgi:hypothetical protein
MDRGRWCCVREAGNFKENEMSEEQDKALADSIVQDAADLILEGLADLPTDQDRKDILVYLLAKICVVCGAVKAENGRCEPCLERG